DLRCAARASCRTASRTTASQRTGGARERVRDHGRRWISRSGRGDPEGRQRDARNRRRIMTSATPVLEARAVTKTFESDGAPVRALRGLNFTMSAGEFVAIMGPSGCGKSTLLNLAAGLDTPTDGEVLVAGEALNGKDENELARLRRAHVGIVFQFFNLLEGMSVLENVTLPAVIAGVGRRKAETRARDLLDLLGLADKAREAPGVLSGGHAQRLGARTGRGT